MILNKLKIKLFGEGLKLSKIFLSEEQNILWTTIAKRMNQPLASALANPYFYHLLKDEKTQTLDDINASSFEGLLNTPKNQIEIWYKGKKVQQFKINDLRKELLLFPLFETTNSELPLDFNTGIIIEQNEIGLIATYEIMTKNLNINDLQFHLLDIDNSLLLYKIEYQNQVLTNVKKDSLLTYTNGFEKS